MKKTKVMKKVAKKLSFKITDKKLSRESKILELSDLIQTQKEMLKDYKELQFNLLRKIDHLDAQRKAVVIDIKTTSNMVEEVCKDINLTEIELDLTIAGK